ncbi:4-hydroxy-tetrahydrodipicolinate synthase [Alicyclobacillus ferrooxydans]|uniref:4-hydroxy-tetrahydrodipicolinate synthase n=1 Tax=Alicyclobacillus ferrooxydans TaxID=471514 RepID=A0A0P9C4D7_9BACL|nr:4-hydroxy-tetrahydrodipicolinate synthase [Alicyclobacillus ferrooxydans]KPV39842.1 dihydrodipicolinate synthase [Alicyclobacillus ferrooxydans]
MDFGRLITAMATPFDTAGAIDVPGVKTLVKHLLSTGTTAVVAAGTTGESPTLSHEEKLELFELTLRAADGQIPVIAGTASNDTRASIELSKEAEKLGVQGLLLVAPYYNRPSQDGLYAHFKAIAESVNIPVMLYNVPGRTGVNIDVSTILRLADIPNVTAVKEASGSMNQILQLAAKKPDDLLLYSGDDKLTIPMMCVGAYGVVSVAAHVVGEEMSKMIEAFVAGDVKTAAVWSGRLLPVFEALFATSSPGPLKAALKQMGLPGGSVRLPLVDAPEEIGALMERQLTRLGKVSIG